MSREVDFTVSNLSKMGKIAKPSLNRQSGRLEQQKQVVKAAESKSLIAKASSKSNIDAKPKGNRPSAASFSIEPSFIPENSAVSDMNPAVQAELQKLKDFAKRKMEKQRTIRRELAEGIITREDLNKKEGEKMQGKMAQAEKDLKEIVVDSSGRVRDKQGNLKFQDSRPKDFIINQKKEREKDRRQYERKSRIKQQERVSRKLFDRHLFMGRKNKKLKIMQSEIQFLEKGSYRTVEEDQQLAENRDEESIGLEDMLKDNYFGDGEDDRNQGDLEKNQVKKQAGDDVSEDEETQKKKRPSLRQRKLKIIKKRMRIKVLVKKDTPNIEWWDQPLLKGSFYPEYDGNRIIKLQADSQKQESTHLSIFDMINAQALGEQVTYQRVGNPDAKQEKVVMPTYLTKDERQKLKRKRKREKLQEKNDKIKLGIMKPDKPKLKVSNMAVVMKDEFIMDPSRIESLAKQETQERLSTHLQKNQTRKLTKLKKQEKIIRKLKRDSSKECRRALFRVDFLDNPAHLFKVNMNAKQLALNGLVIRPNSYHRQPVLIAVEGGTKAIKFYRNLMLNRIDWTDPGELESVTEARKKNSCRMVWEGVVENTTLGKWKNYEASDEPQTLRILNQKGIGNFWDYVANA